MPHCIFLIANVLILYMELASCLYYGELTNNILQDFRSWCYQLQADELPKKKTTLMLEWEQYDNSFAKCQYIKIY